MTITVSTDGSALGNPNGPMGWAWADHATNAARTPEHQHDGDSDAGGATNGTNQIGELCAVLEALRAHRGSEPLTIETDSQYAINCSTTWVKGWKKNGWKNSQKKPVKNAPLIKAIDAEIAARKGPVAFVWVKGHNGNPGNEKVDELAHTYSGDARSGVKDGYLPLEGWQSLLASPYAKGLDIPSDAQMLIDGKITEEQYHLGRGGEAEDDNEEHRKPKPTLEELLAEPEGVPEYDFSPRQPEAANQQSAGNDGPLFSDTPAATDSQNEAVVSDKVAEDLSAPEESNADKDASQPNTLDDDAAQTNTEPNTDDEELPDSRNDSASSASSEVKNSPDKTPAQSDDSEPSESAPESDEDIQSDLDNEDTDAQDTSDANAVATNDQPSKTPEPAYLANGLTVNGTLHFFPAPQTSSTYDGKARHIRGVIAVDGYVAGDGSITLNNAQFLIANDNAQNNRKTQ
ncbi:ribonuclease HI [Bifidobacterium commune]|uniref:ribonuclease H n=1 Tax=Bifidobacterium commune TaxID=1505727 RepID=A0A1C4H496_9BIFI|nr:RNase H family protein [Bifidobacterium commune]MBB2955139.1 ribonuclease HI [Bifidobacterium commune]SCC79685.1 ribonuclease HI [Bifidobacterium commune]